MAGVKGRSGGARPNTGPKTRPPVVDMSEDAREFLTKVMQGVIVPSVAQLEAAKTLARGVAIGVKEQRQEKAKRIATGKFATAEAPRLVVNNK